MPTGTQYTSLAPSGSMTGSGDRARSILDEVNVCLDPTISSAPSSTVGGSGARARSVLDEMNVYRDPRTSLAPSVGVSGDGTNSVLDKMNNFLCERPSQPEQN
jgi:hypothetical protein